MKRFFLFLAIPAITLNLYCQSDVIVLDSIITFYWDSNINDWGITGKNVNEYYENQKINKKLRWEDETFICLDSTVYTYDLFGNEVQVTFFDRDTIQNSWTGKSNYTSEYDENGNVTKSAKYEWDTLSSEWNPVNCESTTYDVYSNELESKYYIWNTSINEWEITAQGINTYDEDGRQLESVIHAPTWPVPDGLLIHGWKTKYYWSNLNSPSKVKQQELSCSIYPNPTNSHLTIETGQPNHHSIEIISLSGQLICNAKMEGTTHQIDLSSFQKGLYFITIRSKDYIKTEKIIKL